MENVHNVFLDMNCSFQPDTVNSNTVSVTTNNLVKCVVLDLPLTLSTKDTVCLQDVKAMQ